ncbi:MAG: hypothetical protein AAFN81_05765 [Bacteroidota bacterium]
MKVKYIVYSLFLAILFTGCQATEAYRKAQTAFSQGAAIEMRERFADAQVELPNNFFYFNDFYRTNTEVDPNRSAPNYYAEALKEATAALKGKKQLSKNLALDNAYAIQALSLWRLGKYKEAKEVAAVAVPLLEKNEGDESDFRDLAMMQALPGLINIDESYTAVEQIQRLGTALTEAEDEEQRQDNYQQIKTLFNDHFLSDADGAPSVTRGLAIIERAITNAEDENAVGLYLRNAQLAGIDNWGDAFQVVFLSARRLDNNSTEGTWVLEGRDTYKDLLKEYIRKLENSLPDGQTNKLYQYWTRILGGTM